MCLLLLKKEGALKKYPKFKKTDVFLNLGYFFNSPSKIGGISCIADVGKEIKNRKIMGLELIQVIREKEKVWPW